jgi:E3 ubiquitin-protein ligase MARCH6
MTLPLFPENTIQVRMEWLNKMPISGLAVLWALGGFFMVSFASSISFMRSFMRPGLLFFLRNPLDPDNHPVREMVERSFFDQIYRIAISVIFYAILIGSSFGVFVQLAKFAIFPLHLKFTNPLIEVPVDLLLHLVLRSLSQSCSPIKYTKALAILACKRVCRHLRLSSYFIGGGRYLAEETGPKDGSFVAVPDFDRLYKRERLREIRSQTISPLDVSKLKIVSDRHNTPVMDTSTTTPPPSYHNKDWAVVFRPNSFKLRCAAFLLCAIFAVQVYLFGVFVAPLLTGRLCVSWAQKTLLGASQTRVHDIYTWALGSAIFLLTFKLLQILLEPREKNTSSANQTRVSFNFVKTLHLALKAVIVSFFIGFVWPVLAGLLFTLIINPIIYQQYASSATMTNNTSEFFSFFFQNQQNQQVSSIVAVFFSACWSMGFPILRLIYAMRRHFPFITQGTLQFLQDWRDNVTFERLSVRRFLQSLALPFTCSLLLCLLLPPTICTLVVPLFSSHESVMEAQHSSHLLALLAFILLKGFKASIGLCKMAISTIRDDNYLIGRRLHNLETRR